MKIFKMEFKFTHFEIKKYVHDNMLINLLLRYLNLGSVSIGLDEMG